MADQIPVNVVRSDAQPIAKPAQGFHFVDQGNYLTLPVAEGLTIYSDSATSCIITIILARKGGDTTVTLAHLDSAACIDSFFKIVAARDDDLVQIYAQGANPPDNPTAQQNASALKAAVADLGSCVAVADLFLSGGSPRDENRGHFGMTVGSSGITVTNQPYALALTDRDPTCGGQTVYCIMRRQEHPPVEIRNAALPFTHAELVELAAIAVAFRKDRSDPSTAFCNIVNMQSEDIRQQWSTTPQYEAPWFSDELKQGACFAIAMAPVVSLSAYQLSRAPELRFARLRAALLGSETH